MGSVLSVYSKYNPIRGWWGKAEVMTNDHEPEVQDMKGEIKKLSDPSYTLIYQDKEEEVLRKFKEERDEKERQRLRDMGDAPRKKKKNKNKNRGIDKVAISKVAKQVELQQRKIEHDEFIAKNKIKVQGNVKEFWCDQSWKNNPDLCKFLGGRRFVHCPNQFCRLPFEKVLLSEEPERVLSAVLGEDGKPLSDIHAAHYNKHRFRCRQCDTVFCAVCKAMPYHAGKTCKEFRSPQKRVCRFCKKGLPEPVPNGANPPLPQVDNCKSAPCSNYSARACPVKLDCGHLCSSTISQRCYCLKPSCCSEGSTTEDDFCAICWTEDLGAAPCVKFKCGHIFHRHCIMERIKHMWPGSRISFAFLLCPLCSVPLDTDYSEVMYSMKASKDLEAEIKMKALHFLKAEGLENDPQITTPGKKFYNNPSGFAMDLFCFYKCFKCNLPYYGGKRNCEAGQDGLIVFNPEELVCGGCSGTASCDKHGKQHIHYKCRFCCSLASWFCFGLVHYCEKCHSEPYKYWSGSNLLISVPPQCKGKDLCPLGIDHPPNGFEEVVLGCSMCKIEEATGQSVESVVENDDDDYYW